MDEQPGLGKLIAQALTRSTMASLVLVFGSPESRRPVEHLVDGKLPEGEAQAVREGLDRAWRKFTGSGTSAC